MPEPINPLDELMAAATAPIRPEPAVEEDVLLRLEQEVERLRGEPDSGASVVAVAAIGPTPSRRRDWRIGPALLTAAAVFAGVLGVALSGVDESVQTDLGGSVTPTTERLSVVSQDELADPIDRVDAACLETLPTLIPGERSVVPTASDEQSGARLQSLLGLTEALREPIEVFGAERPEITESLSNIEFELKNAALLYKQGHTDGARYSVPRLTAELDTLLAALVESGAPSCGLWS